MLNILKKFIVIVAVVLLASPVVALANDFGCTDGTYVISAYYSPLPGQSRYATGTYTGDIRLNGGGVTTASGVKVADAEGPFLAAPPCFAFNTLLEVDGLGNHLVLDRGGAIKGNRLDIWMGYGDVGLHNALSWGKRSVFVKVAEGSPASKFDFDIGSNSIKPFQKVSVSNPFDFINDLKLGDTGEDVARLQQILKDHNFYEHSVTGVYDQNTKDAVSEFQDSHGLLKPDQISQRGQFARDQLKILNTFVITNREDLFELPTRNLARGSSGADVLKLQKLLKFFGYNINLTRVFDAETFNALVQFQIDNNIFESETTPGIGYYGVKTQIVVEKLIQGKVVKVNEGQENNDLDSATEVDIQEKLLPYLIFNIDETADSKDISLLQKILYDLNFLKIEPNSVFGPLTKHALANFQLNMRLKNPYDESLGIMDDSTRSRLNAVIQSRNDFLLSLSNDQVMLASADKNQEDTVTQNLNFKDRNEEVVKLQGRLRKLGYFKSPLSSDYFGQRTLDAVLELKKDFNLDLNSTPIIDDEFLFLINSL